MIELYNWYNRCGFRPKTWRFEWNGLDRLVAAFCPDGSAWVYTYDAFARRLSKEQRRARPEGGSNAAGTRVEYLWDGDVIAYERVIDGDDVATVNWYFEPSTFVPIARKEGDYLSYVVTDHLGTPKEVVSEIGDLEWAAEYRTWGEIKRFESHAPKPRSKPQTEHDQWGFIPLDAEGSAARALHEKPDAHYCPIRFQGQWEDQETGLYYNRFRYYDISSGQYLTFDPYRLNGGLRSYGYATSSNKYVDPFGLQQRRCRTEAECRALYSRIARKSVGRKGQGSPDRGLLERIEELREDRLDLYNLAYSQNNYPSGHPLGGKGTYVGHMQQATGLKAGLNRDIIDYEMSGCNSTHKRLPARFKQIADMAIPTRPG